jgi:RNA polymerase sigma-70 factor (ECF subfamily)
LNDQPELDLDTIHALIGQARDGDQEAKSDLAQQVQKYLAIRADKQLDRSLRANLHPSDIVQKTLIKMVQGIDNFRGTSTEEFYGWLNRIIQHETAKATRDLKRKKRDIRRQRPIGGQDSRAGNIHEPSDYNPTPGTNAILNERVELFHKALSQLPEDYEMVIRLRNLDQLSFKDIASKMNRSVDSVSKLWYRAVVSFQRQLEQLDDKSR